MSFSVKRVYDAPARDDGYRVLVDRLYPRGVARSVYKLWLRDIAPSRELLTWYHADPAKRWPAFRSKYKRELLANTKVLDTLVEIIKNNKRTTLLYAAKFPNNNAVVLADVLRARLTR